MSVQVRFPLELLAHIVAFLSDDKATLRNLCLASHLLRAVACPLLFASRDFRSLGCSYLRPFLPYTQELRISWRPDMHRGRDADVLAESLKPYLSAESTPRLQKLVIRGIGLDGMDYLNTLSDALKSFASLTTLFLNETYHRNMREVQALITSLPHLAHLSVNAIMINTEYDDFPDGESKCLDGPALKFLRVSPVYPNSMLPLVDWLARTPSAHSLQTLEVPAQARIGPSVLPHWGPSVRHLSAPLRGLLASSLESYTSLESLTLYAGMDDMTTHQYARLAEIIAALPCRTTLRVLTLHVPYAATFSHSGSLDVFDGIDDVLFGREKAARRATGDRSVSPGFDVLDGVRIVFQATIAVSDQDRAETVWCQRLHMQRADALGKLSIAFARDDNMARAFTGRSWA